PVDVAACESAKHRVRALDDERGSRGIHDPIARYLVTVGRGGGGHRQGGRQQEERQGRQNRAQPTAGTHQMDSIPRAPSESLGRLSRAAGQIHRSRLVRGQGVHPRARLDARGYVGLILPAAAVWTAWIIALQGLEKSPAPQV